MKEQKAEPLAEKELAEQLKRGKPKDAKKLFELLVKNGDQNSAKASILDVLKQCYETMPNGRMKLDAKKYGSLIESQLKEIKTNLQPLYFRMGPKPTSFGASAKKTSGQPKKKAFRAERYKTIDDFAHAFEELVFDDAAAAKLYLLNKDVYFAGLDEAIAQCGKQPVTIDELDGNGEKRDFFFANLIEDICMALYNASRDDASLVKELETYVYEVTARPIDWDKERFMYENLFDFLLDATVVAGDEEKAQRITEAWRKKFPDTLMPEKATLFGLTGRKDDASMQKAWELSERIMKENPVFKGNEPYMLEIIEDVYQWKGETDKAETVRNLKKKYYEQN